MLYYDKNPYHPSRAMFDSDIPACAVLWVLSRIEPPAIHFRVTFTVCSSSIIAAAPHTSITVHERFTMTDSEVPATLSVVATPEHYNNYGK